MLKRPIAVRADIKDIDIAREPEQFPPAVNFKVRRFVPIRYRFDLMAPSCQLMRHLPGVDRGAALRRVPFKADQIADIHLFPACLSNVSKDRVYSSTSSRFNLEISKFSSTNLLPARPISTRRWG